MEVTAYQLVYSPESLEDIKFFKKLGDASIIRKINRLLDELEQHPASGSGQVEALRYDLTGFWSRRINKEHRLLYQIDDDKKIVYIYRLKDHY